MEDLDVKVFEPNEEDVNEEKDLVVDLVVRYVRNNHVHYGTAH